MDDNDCKRFILVYPNSEYTEEVSVPIICLSDDDEKDDFMIDKDYKSYLDQLCDDNNNNLVSFLEDDNAESKPRKFACDSKRSKHGNENQRKRKAFGFEAETVTTRESIERDNRIAKRPKRNMEAAKVSRDVDELLKVESLKNAHLDSSQEAMQKDNKSKTLRNDDPLDITQNDNQRNKKAKEMFETLWDVPLAQTQEVIERDEVINSVKALCDVSDVRIQRDIKVSKSKDETLWDVPLVTLQEVIQRDNELNVETMRTDPLVRTKEDIQRDSAIMDKDYISYLTWLVDSLRDLVTTRMSTSKTRKESTLVQEKVQLVQVKTEPQDLDYSSDDSDIIEVSDTPFLYGKDTPFVTSKSRKTIDVDKEKREEDETSTWFKTELLNVLSKPYDRKELLMLSNRVSIQKPLTRCREFRKGREITYETGVLGKSYLEKFSDFDQEYKLANGDNKKRLKLLRGFFFYLENISQDGAFMPWKHRKYL